MMPDPHRRRKSATSSEVVSRMSGKDRLWQLAGIVILEAPALLSSGSRVSYTGKPSSAIASSMR